MTAVQVLPLADIQMSAAIEAKRNKFLKAVTDELGRAGIIPQRKRYQSRFDRIAQRLCRVFGVTLADLRSPRRNGKSMWARLAVYYWARRITTLSYPAIGRLLGGRDHTTVMRGVFTYQSKRQSMGRSLRVLHSKALAASHSGVAQ